MKKDSMKKGLMFILLLLTLSIAITIRNTVSASPQPTISVRNPQTGTNDFIFYTNTTTAGSRFNVTVDISEGTDVFSWQVYMTYNVTLLNATGGWVPSTDPEYIFYGLNTFTPPTYFDRGVVQIGDVTLPVTPPAVGVNFTTPKKLAIIEFEVLVEPPKGIGNKVSSTLAIDYESDTFIIDSDGNYISPVNRTNGSYELNWVKPASTISLNVNPDTVDLGDTVTISGTIDPPRPNVTVTIYHRPGTTGDFTNLTTVQTNNESNYSYTWTSDVAGAHEFKASWAGDANYTGAESPVKTVTVNKLTSTITFDANPTSVQVGENVTLSGTITPAGVTVTISYRPEGGDFDTLTTVTAGSDGTYSYVWETTDSGTFELKARWAGNNTYNGTVSSLATVEVTAAPVDYLYYIIGAIAIIGIVAIIAIYFLKKR